MTRALFSVIVPSQGTTEPMSTMQSKAEQPTLWTLETTSEHLVATKRITPDGVQGYDRIKHWFVHPVWLDDWHDFVDFLDSMRSQPRACVIRGEPAGKIDSGPLRRTVCDDRREGGNFADCDRRWVCVDFDGLSEPESYAALADQLRQALPDWLRSSRCVWHVSASSGFGGTVGMHLWFWLDGFACSRALRRTLGQHRLVDASLFNPVQVHYTSDPILIDVDDPIGSARRTGTLAGPLATPPPFLRLVDEERRQREAEREQTRAVEAARASMQTVGGNDSRMLALSKRRHAYIVAALESTIDQILSAGKGARHDTIRQGALNVLRLVEAHPTLVSAHAVRARLDDAARATLPPARHAEIERTLQWAHDRAKNDPNPIALELD